MNILQTDFERICAELDGTNKLLEVTLDVIDRAIRPEEGLTNDTQGALLLEHVRELYLPCLQKVLWSFWAIEKTFTQEIERCVKEQAAQKARAAS